MTPTSSPPIFPPPTSTTVFWARNSRLASLNGLVIGMISWMPLRCENASRYAYALAPMTPISVRSSPRDSSVFRPISCTRSTTALISPSVAVCPMTMITRSRSSAIGRREIRRIGALDEGGTSTGPERIRRMREDRSARANARIGRLGAEDPANSLRSSSHGPPGIQVGFDRLRVAQIDITYLRLRAVRVVEQKDTDAHRHAPWVRQRHLHVVAAQQGHLEPAELARSVGGELRVEILRGGEEGKANLRLVEGVGLDQLAEKLVGGLGDGLGGVSGRRGRAADAPHRHAFKSSLIKGSGSLPASISATTALPTAAASATPRRAFMFSAREMPNPAATGSSVRSRTLPTSSLRSAGSCLRAPVMPVSVTQ